MHVIYFQWSVENVSTLTASNQIDQYIVHWYHAAAVYRYIAIACYSRCSIFVNALQNHPGRLHIDGLGQDCSNCSALAMELLQSCTKPSI